MEPILDKLIDRFRKAQDVAVDILTNKLRIPRPESNRAWAMYCAENGLHYIREQSGIGIYTHGFGVELKIDDLIIDFDWGDNGEPDGFDGWRLYNFSLDNCPDMTCSHNQVDEWLARAHNDGELIEEGRLYYDPKRRAG